MSKSKSKKKESNIFKTSETNWLDPDKGGMPANYKTSKCKTMDEDSICRYGEKCMFAHNDIECKRGLERLERLEGKKRPMPSFGNNKLSKDMIQILVDENKEEILSCIKSYMDTKTYQTSNSYSLFNGKSIWTINNNDLL